MRLNLGCPVRCSDGPFGDLADVVVDPTRRRLTHLVVEPHHRHGLARLVPVELATADDASRGIAVRSTLEELRGLPTIEEFAYLRLGEFPLNDPDWDVGIQNVLAHPYYDYPGVGGLHEPGIGGMPMGYDPHVAITYDRIPKGEVEIRRASDVFSGDGHWLGHVDGLLVDEDDRITHVVLERGHLFGHREVTIPIASVTRVENDSITANLTKDEVRRLPSVPVHRWISRVTGTDRREAEGPLPAA